MVGEFEVEVVRLHELKFVNDCIEQNLTDTLQLYKKHHITTSQVCTHNDAQ